MITINNTENNFNSQETTNFTSEQVNISPQAKVQENTKKFENETFKNTSSSLLKTPTGTNTSEVFFDKEQLTEELEPWRNISLTQEEVKNKTGFVITNNTEDNINNNERQGRNAKPTFEMKKEGSEESPGSGIDEIKGILVEPPSRGSLWRKGFFAPKNIFDDETNCGGFIEKRKSGLCGVCGDRFTEKVPRDHESGGRFGQRIISRNYLQGSLISVRFEPTVPLNTSRLFFQISICKPHEDGLEEETCFQPFEGEMNKLRIYGSQPYSTQHIDIEIKLPQPLVCSRCVLRLQILRDAETCSCALNPREISCPCVGELAELRSCSDIRIVQRRYTSVDTLDREEKFFYDDFESLVGEEFKRTKIGNPYSEPLEELKKEEIGDSYSEPRNFLEDGDKFSPREGKITRPDETQSAVSLSRQLDLELEKDPLISLAQLLTDQTTSKPLRFPGDTTLPVPSTTQRNKSTTRKPVYKSKSCSSKSTVGGLLFLIINIIIFIVK
ncbi:uncharacterized protein LOC111698099 isoform X2 [Eurytemora carolleeae]|uniref:uncharacterized protein LOC111698099 isoform X2 n=1 Tax=Eurytemora carolleeae TaxID=1294199 RepID=UPI000C76B506|nr:uncharacterized protein LOC111698099 isoform X2 [Eurytemora carolleeae]|eukprot:XP_023324112.1 uncharacterized protein LOC111698099 isoform X2 [Eurytemora affinis]